jgi:hypothetical protein
LGGFYSCTDSLAEATRATKAVADTHSQSQRPGYRGLRISLAR